MNPDQPLTPREELEIKITALLMGQLTPEEAAMVEAQIAADPELATLHAGLRRAVELLRASRTAPEAPAPTVLMQISKERREKMLAAFRGTRSLPKPPPLSKPPVPQLVHKPRKNWARPVILTASIAALVVVVGSLMMPAFSPMSKRALEASRFAAEEEGAFTAKLEVPSAAEPAPQHSLLYLDADSTSSSAPMAPSSGIAFGLSPESKTDAMRLRGTSGGVQGVAGGQTTPNSKLYAVANQPAGSGPATGSFRISVASADAPVAGGLPGSMRGRTGGGTAGAGGGGVYLPAAPAPEAPALPPPAENEFRASNLAGLGANRAEQEKHVEITQNNRKELNFGFLLGQDKGPSISDGAVEEKLKSLTESAGERYTRHDAELAKADGSRTKAGGNAAGAPGLNGTLTFNDADNNTYTGSTSVSGGRLVVPKPAGAKQVDGLEDEDSDFSKLGNGRVIAGVPITAGNRSGQLAISGEAIDALLFDQAPASTPTPANKTDGTRASGKIAQPAKPAAPVLQQRLTGMISDPAGRPTSPTDDLGSVSNSSTVERELTRRIQPNLGTDKRESTSSKPRPEEQVAEELEAQAKAFPEMGQSELAARKYDETLKNDPNKAAALEGLKLAKGLKEKSADAGAAQSQAMHEVTNLWERPYSRDKRQAPPGGSSKDTAAATTLYFADESASRAEAAKDGKDGYWKYNEGKSDGKNAAWYGTAAANGPVAALSQPAVEFDGFINYGSPIDRSGVAITPNVVREPMFDRGTSKHQDDAFELKAYMVPVPRSVEAFPLTETTLPLPNEPIAGLGDIKNPEPAAAAEAKPEAEKKAELTAKIPAATSDPAPPAKAPEPAPVPQPEVSAKENAFSTFSLNVSDVSFQLASASLEKGRMPEPATVRSEEFINALNYRDPEPAPGAPFAFATERARYPFAHNRDLLRISLKTAAAGREPGRPLNLVLLVDNSGSMERADRVRILRESMRVLAQQLKPEDKLSLITFSRAPRLWADGVPGDKAMEVAQRAAEITPEGGTDLSAAMDLGYKTALKHYQAGSVNRVVLMTDGAANLGDVRAEALKQKVEAHRKQGVAFDCFGVGWEGYNDDLLEQLSRNGDGRYGFINTPEAATIEFAGQLAGALRVAASDVKVQIEFNPRRVTAYRQVGYAKHQLKKEQFRDNTVDAAEIGAAESGNALYVVEVNPRGEGDIATARARFKVPGTSDYREQEWTIPYSAPASPLEQSSSSLRLAATASAFSEWLAQSPYAAEVTPDRLLGLINGIPAIYGADKRPAKLEAMIRQARSIR